MTWKVELDRESDGRWIAEIPALPGALTYGLTSDDATRRALDLADNVFADRLAHNEPTPSEDPS